MTMKISRKRRKVIGNTSLKRVIPAAEAISNNVDVLTEIFLRVPAKSIIRFRCVSKHWLSLISNTHFVRNHARVNYWPQVYGFYYEDPSYDKQKTISLHGYTTLPTLDFLQDQGKTVYPPRVVHSCNGLILCKKFDRPLERYIVCNPTTQKYTILPEAPVMKNASGFAIVHGNFLAFDPSKSPHYKVLMAEYYKGSFSIFSSEHSAWKQVSIIPPPPSKKNSDYFFGGIFWSESIHWLNNEIFLRFDFELEQLMWMPHPLKPKILPVYKIRYFGECCGHLILIQSHLPSAMVFSILEMERDYSCWIAKYWVNLGHLTSAFAKITRIKNDYKFHFLSVIKGKSEKHFTLVLAIAGTIISYDLKCKTWTVLDFPGGFPFNYRECFQNSYQFIESLAPI